MTLILVITIFVVLAVASTGYGRGPTVQTRTAETIVATWQCEDKLPRPRTRARSPWKRHSHAYRAAELTRWAHRLAACTAVLAERARQWNWQAWLPDKWRRVGGCETGLNWHHHNSSYTSAFGISVREYDRDAAFMGVRPWYVRGLPDPSPWEQWRAAVGHYTRFGGFSGWGCRGA